jgi:hypothetical protein
MAWALAAVLGLIVGLGAVAALALAGGDDDDGESASELDTGSSTTSTTRRELGVPGQLGSSTTVGSSTSSTVGIGGGGTGGSGSSSTSTTKKPSTTTSSTLQEDTSDPDCSKQGVGDAAADPFPVTVSFCVDDAHPKVGQTVKITGVAKDPDSQVEPDCIRVTFDGVEPGTCTVVPNPSNPVANQEFTVFHTFTTPGDHTIHVAAASDPPHGSTASTSYKITVHA